jgi:hypothetical protein
MAINSFPPSGEGPIEFPDQLIDPVSKFRVSNPENLIDTDFEYGLQPTKWETVELINNTPSFFSKSGDTTIDGISSIITNAGTREIIVKTELDHGLAVGIPINVTGTKSITADGAYIINSIPDTKTFTYLCKDNQTDTNSILDLYSSIITGEFFQGSQLRISDSDGIVTDAEGTSILTVTTNTTHGFGENTPFYFLNLNSTVAQEFQAANTASKSFDASNSATAQTFDGSNSLSSVNIDWSNSATFGGTPSTISGTNQTTDTITVTHQAGENFNNLPLGTPLYYSVSATGGYFNTNPRGVVFLKTTNQLGTSTSTFQVSLVPDGNAIDLTSNLSGTFQIANQARTFAGNNIDPLTQTVVDVEVGPSFDFDGGNQGYAGAVQGTPPNNTLTVLSYTGTSINADGASNADYYVGAMVFYTTTGTAATGLTGNTTYFVTSVTNNSGGNYDFSVAALPGGTPISITAGSGSGTQTFSRIGVSIDKDIVHIKDSGFQPDDMLEYSFPADGRFGVELEEQEKRFYFVETAYDAHNYKLSEDVGFKPIVATGGTILPEIQDRGRTWRVHQFTTVGTSSFVVSDPGKEGLVEYLVIAGGGGGGNQHGGGGGAGGYRTNVFGELSGGGASAEAPLLLTAGSYTVTVGAGGAGTGANAGQGIYGQKGGNSVFHTIVAQGGGGGGSWAGSVGVERGPGGSGGGVWTTSTGGINAAHPGTVGQGFAGARGIPNDQPHGGPGGGGAGSAGVDASISTNPRIAGSGGQGVASKITGTRVIRASGGGGGVYHAGSQNIPIVAEATPGGGGEGGLSNTGGFDSRLRDATANTGGGGGAAGSFENRGGNGASGIVIIRYPITPEVEFVPATATGGTLLPDVTVRGITYRVHRFATTGTTNFVVSSPGSWNQFEYLIVAGGGGGEWTGSGGGAGGMLEGVVSLSPGTYPVVVGAGGVGGVYLGVASGQGGNSSFNSIVASGGGRGVTHGNQNGVAGGSGSGSTIRPSGTLLSGGAGIAGQGFRGGNGFVESNWNGINGGGGGAGGVGFNAGPGTGLFGQGGPGRASTITGSSVFYAGGGAGGDVNANFGSLGGIGGGGRSNGDTAGSAATANTGGGGGGGGFTGTYWPGGAGGSGVVIIRYPIAVAS